jgi:Putative adhesin
VNGRVIAEASDGTAIEVRAERTTKASSDESARELLAKIEMREEVGDGRVRVEVRAPRFIGSSGHEIKWTLKIPRGVAVDLRTVNGGVKLTGLEGEIRARSTNGGISGTAINATSLDAAVTNGGVDIELAQAVSSGHFDLEAVNGGVSLSLPADSKVDISGRCVNGSISVSNLDVVTVGEQTRRRLDGQLNGGGARVTLETVNGGVKIGRAQSTS